MGDKDRFSVRITGSTIGAVAVGSGATVEGSVTKGGSTPAADATLKATVDLRGASSQDQIAARLRAVADKIEDGKDVGAIGRVTGANASGVAWKVEVETG